MQSDTSYYEADDDFKCSAHINSMAEYKELYEESMKNPDKFWSDFAEQFFWKQKPDNRNVLQYNFDCTRGPIYINAFKDGTTNMCYNVLDRMVEKGLGDKIAFYWDGNDPMDFDKYSYHYLYTEVDLIYHRISANT